MEQTASAWAESNKRATTPLFVPHNVPSDPVGPLCIVGIRPVECHSVADEHHVRVRHQEVCGTGTLGQGQVASVRLHLAAQELRREKEVDHGGAIVEAGGVESDGTFAAPKIGRLAEEASAGSGN